MVKNKNKFEKIKQSINSISKDNLYSTGLSKTSDKLEDNEIIQDEEKAKDTEQYFKENY